MNAIHLSEEQQLFVHEALKGHNILVNACIGSGKTTAIQLLCSELPKNKNILYLTYNRLLKLDAQVKIQSKNATVQNYHGIAWYYLNRNNISAGISDLITRFNEIKPPIEHYDVLIIDEYQDIESEMADLLEYVKSSNPSMQIIAVGDMQQKIYDKTTLNVEDFIHQFLGKYIELEFTQCFRLSADLAEKLGRIWNKKINGVNSACVVEEMSLEQVVEFLADQDPRDILCLGARSGDLSKTLNMLEKEHPSKFNKRTVFASISDDDSLGSTRPSTKTAIFTTFDSSKGLERKICVVFDFTESYWSVRISNPQQSYEILRNIFCVAASRGKSKIIFVNSGEEMLSEATLSTRVGANQKLVDVDISAMFDFKYRENIETCYRLVQVVPIISENHDKIEVKRTDGMIDLSPCIGIYQEAMFFNSYDIDKTIELYFSLHKDKKQKAALWHNKIIKTDLETKILFFVSLETNQDRYRTQVELPFIHSAAKKQLAKRLLTKLQRDEAAQVECFIPFSDKKNGERIFSACGFADVVKDGTVYELKFVSELTHEHFLQCACYMAALNLEKGILWNTRDNTAYEIRIPEKKKFLDAVANTITKNTISSYFAPSVRKIRTENSQTSSIVKRNIPSQSSQILKQVVGAKVFHEKYGNGRIIKVSTLGRSHLVDISFEESKVRKFLLESALGSRSLHLIQDEKTAQAVPRQPKKDSQRERYENGYQDVKGAFIQQTDIIRDRYGNRWVQCEKCGTIKQDVEFVSYGGRNHINLGLCRDCYRNREDLYG